MVVIAIISFIGGYTDEARAIHHFLGKRIYQYTEVTKW